MERIFNTITLHLFSLKNFQDYVLANGVINTINQFGKDFIPQVFDYYEPLKRKYNEGDSQSVAHLWVNDEANKVAFKNEFAGSHIIMQKKKGHKVEYSINWRKDNTITFNTISITIELAYFKTGRELEEFLNLCKELSVIIEPVYGMIQNESFPGWAEPINLTRRLPNTTWMTIFGKLYIEMFGKAKLLNTPCYKVNEISDSLIFMQSTESVFEPIPEDVKTKIKYHLGEESFVWDGKDYRSYKDGKTPNFDYSEVLFDKTKPIITPQVKTRQK